MKTTSIHNARHHCANFWTGKCLGAMFTRMSGSLTCRIDGKFANKDCVVEKGCTYFEQTVVPGIKGL